MTPSHRVTGAGWLGPGRSARQGLSGLVAVLVSLCVVSPGVAELREPPFPGLELVDVRRIWDRAPHNAFTDLIRFDNAWYCAFREGREHVSDDGKLRVIRSSDGERWTSVRLLEWTGRDVRDAKLSVTRSGELMVNGAVRFIQPAGGKQHHSAAWFHKRDGAWLGPFAYDDGLGTWRWSVTWLEDTAYSFGYSGDDAGGCFYRSPDGKSWDVVVDDVYPDVESYGNESSIVFSESGRAMCLLRRDGGTTTALLGFSEPPYGVWDWRDLGVRVGGPKMIDLGAGRLLATVRLYDGRVRTSVCWIDPVAVTLTEVLELPSGGDTSYAGMVRHGDEVWISYYSSHEEKSAIYLAKIALRH